MVLLIISLDGAVNEDTLRRGKDFSDINVDWVRMAQSVLRYNVVIVGKFFNRGSWVSEAWRKEHPEEIGDEPDGPPEIIETTEKPREQFHLELDHDSVRAVCVGPLGTPPSHGVRLTSVGRGHRVQQVRTNQPA